MGVGYVFDEDNNQLGVRMNDTGEVVRVIWLDFDYTIHMCIKIIIWIMAIQMEIKYHV